MWRFWAFHAVFYLALLVRGVFLGPLTMNAHQLSFLLIGSLGRFLSLAKLVFIFCNVQHVQRGVFGAVTGSLAQSALDRAPNAYSKRQYSLFALRH